MRCTAIDQATAADELSQILGQLLHVHEDPDGAEAQLVQRLKIERQEGNSALGSNLAQWEDNFHFHRADYEMTAAGGGGGRPGQAASDLLQFVRVFMTRVVAHCEQKFVSHSTPRTKEIIEAAVQSVVISKSVHEGLMLALQQAHLVQEQGFLELRLRLEERGCTQLDFGIPKGLADIGVGSHGGAEEPWGKVCEYLRQISEERSTTAQLRHLMDAAGAVYSTVKANQPPKPAKQWTCLGADEFTPIFMWAVPLHRPIDLLDRGSNRVFGLGI